MGKEQIGVQVKYPTVLLVDPQGSFVSFGDKAFEDFKKLKDQAKDYYLFHRFKMKLYDQCSGKVFITGYISTLISTVAKLS